jgi:DNA-directed RNA polymerase specialized sigma24 family protein
MLHSVYVDGLSSAEAARRHLTSPGSVRVRSSKAVKRLAAHAAELAEVA